MNHYIFDTKRTKCPYCGSSDGFAHLLHPDTQQPAGDGIGKCHSCAVFKTSKEAGFIADGGQLVASRGIVEPKYFEVSKLPTFGLTAERSNLVQYVESLTGADIVIRVAQEMMVFGDVWGNTSFVYADLEQRGMSVKTIVYGPNGRRDKHGLKLSGRTLDTSQIAGYVTAEGAVRYARVGDGAYQFLYNQHSLRGRKNRDVIAVVESEKTAFILNVFAEMLGQKMVFVASGGSNGISQGKVRSLQAAKAIHPELALSLFDAHCVICFDNDDAGEKGSQLAAKGLSELSIKAKTYNMSDLFKDVEVTLPSEKRLAADLADVCVNAFEGGNMLDEIETVLASIYNAAKGIVSVSSAIKNNELSKISKSEYTKAPTAPSLTFTDPQTFKTSQLAIPSNIVMLLASPGVGKSSVISAIVARHIRPDVNAFGLDIVAPKGVLVIDTEQSKDQVIGLHKRLARRIGCETQELPDLFEQSNVNWFVTNKMMKVEKQVDNLFSAVAEIDPSFVIIDQVGSLVNNVNSNDEVQGLVRRIATDAESNARTWVVVLHTNPTSDKGRGVLGSDIHRWASSVLFIKRPAKPEDPCLLTTNNVDGIMAKVRSGPPVRAFFSWDDSRGDFYPTASEPEVDMNDAIVRNALDELFTYTDGAAQPMPMSNIRKALKDMFGALEGTKTLAYMMQKNYLKRMHNGKLWPDYEKLQAK